MTALPRGQCPECGAEVALRKGGLVREHVRWDLPAERYGQPKLPTCEGSGDHALPLQARP